MVDFECQAFIPEPDDGESKKAEKLKRISQEEIKKLQIQLKIEKDKN